MIDPELAAVRAYLDASRRELRNWLVLAAGYLERKAEEGDSLAGFLHARIEAAFDVDPLRVELIPFGSWLTAGSRLPSPVPPSSSAS